MNTSIDLFYRKGFEATGVREIAKKEDARYILPNATDTKIVVTMNARELLHFFELRCCNRAQWEIRDLAFKMLKIVINIAPNIFAYAGAPCMIGKKCTETKRPIRECRMMWKKVEELKEEILGNKWGKMNKFPYTE